MGTLGKEQETGTEEDSESSKMLPHWGDTSSLFVELRKCQLISTHPLSKSLIRKARHCHRSPMSHPHAKCNGFLDRPSRWYVLGLRPSLAQTNTENGYCCLRPRLWASGQAGGLAAAAEGQKCSAAVLRSGTEAWVHQRQPSA